MDDLINQYVEIQVDKQLNALSVKFLKFIPYQEFIKAVEHEYELIRHYNLKKCAIDLRQIPVYDKGMPEYVKDKWFPTVSSLGIKYIGFIVPEAVIGQMSMNRAHQTAETFGIMAIKHPAKAG
jgi:hypothetical protein